MRDYNRTKNRPDLSDQIFAITVMKNDRETAVPFLQKALGREHLMMGK
ncbi:MAG: hypothetical protein ACI4W2_02420 [Eubacterium sp.]